LSVEHVAAVLRYPSLRSILTRSVILVGLVAPWAWLVSIDRLLNRKR
jgi:hypothetical protein